MCKRKQKKSKWNIALEESFERGKRGEYNLLTRGDTALLSFLILGNVEKYKKRMVANIRKDICRERRRYDGCYGFLGGLWWERKNKKMRMSLCKLFDSAIYREYKRSAKGQKRDRGGRVPFAIGIVSVSCGVCFRHLSSCFLSF